MNLHHNHRLAMFSRGGLTAHSLYARLIVLVTLLPLAMIAAWMTGSDLGTGTNSRMTRIELPIAGAMLVVDDGSDCATGVEG